MCLCSFGPNSGVHTYDVTKSKVTYFKYNINDRTLVTNKQEQADSEALLREKVNHYKHMQQKLPCFSRN
ncbi:hypothetical protein FB379_10824 [Aeribacillus composti]|nr:hypothetical protein FB379_10824 [Aeribacillus composti]